MPVTAQKSGDPNVAAVLSWLLPGAGHVYVGRTGQGLLLFAVVCGLYWLGLSFSEGMTFEYLDPELRTMAAPALSPEIGNLGGLIWQMREYGFGDGYPRPWPEHIRLGSYLTSISGILSALVMIHAHLAARVSREKPILQPSIDVGLAWLVPGLGHLRQGRRLRAVLVFSTLVGLFVVGTVLAEATNLSRERHFYYWAGQFMVGLPAMLAELVLGDARVTAEIPYVDAGLVFGCVAGLLNILAMIDVYSFSEARLLGLPLPGAARDEGDSKAAAPETAGTAASAPEPTGAGAP